MKIAFVTDDGKHISKHFGRAPFLLVVDIKDGKLIGREIRSKAGHREFHELSRIEGPHGFGPEADSKHRSMLHTIQDCDVLIAGGMGYGAYRFFTSSGKKVILTDETEIDRALELFLKGKLKSSEGLLD